MDLFAHFDRVYVINLATRVDRRRETLAEMARHATAGSIEEKVEFFAAKTSDVADGFSSPNMRACFLSHLAVLRSVEAAGWERVLVLEDDVVFEDRARELMAALGPEILAGEYDLAQLGYIDVHGHAAELGVSGPALVPFDGEVLGAQCVVYTAAGAARVRAHFERLLTGTRHHPLRGPMPPDGALNVLPWVDSDARRLIAVPCLADQRPSRSDITPSWLDRAPVTRAVAAGLRRSTTIRSLRRRTASAT
ncbi:MAG: glycosyltransferase family 25 protein [Acidimicrobiales bacterium]